MGIPRLSHQLHPYATKILLPNQADVSDPENSTVNAIIDGPSLAYHVYYKCLNRRTRAKNALEAIPPYAELGLAAVTWLRQVEQYGLRIQAIYFDGFLPVSKKPVRLSRLQNYANQLVTFKALHREDLPPKQQHAFALPSDLLSSDSSPAVLKALSAAPFLVNSVIEAIMSSQYQSVTSVVPGEADAYCAQLAKQGDAVILTSDSDLLVHDLGLNGRVVLFKDMEVIHVASKGKILRAVQYHPLEIARRFGLSDLVTLAFFLSEDNHRSFGEAVKLAEGEVLTALEFGAFREQYGALPAHSSLSAGLENVRNHSVETMLARLDPRISEIVHQIRLGATQQPPAIHRTLDMYLPFLPDDPTRTSAWRASTSIQILAFSFLRLLEPSISCINAFERKGTRIGETSLALSQLDDMAASARHWSNQLHGSLSRLSHLSVAARWRTIAAGVVVTHCLDSEKALPQHEDMVDLVIGRHAGPLTWTYIHASAQMQAALYSFRMLHQIIDIVMALVAQLDTNKIPGASSPETLKALLPLQSCLQSLPGIADILELVTPSDGLDAAVSVVKAELGLAGLLEAKEEPRVERRKKKRKRTHVVQREDGASEAWKSNNAFSALS